MGNFNSRYFVKAVAQCSVSICRRALTDIVTLLPLFKHVVHVMIFNTNFTDPRNEMKLIVYNIYRVKAVAVCRPSQLLCHIGNLQPMARP
jgi:hypothetical protein